MFSKAVIHELEKVHGNFSLYYKNLATGEVIAHREEERHIAASVIKLPIMVEAFRQFQAGEAAREEKVAVRDEDRVPSCGTLQFMHSGMEVTLEDLIWLMITISDNMATNLLIDRLGIDAIQATIRGLNLENTVLRRKLFEKREGYKELSNEITALDMAKLLEALYHGQVVSEQASREMLEIMKKQQLKNKMPFQFDRKVPIAHKTGEDTSITHDVGIVFTPRPFIACFVCSGVEPVQCNQVIQRIAGMLYTHCGGV